MQYKSLFILGRLPAIGRAELESLLGADHVSVAGEHMVSDVLPDDIDFARIGGSIRLAKILGAIDAVQWPAIAKRLAQLLPECLEHLPAEGKVKLGLSAFDIPVNMQHLFRTGLELKKICKKANRSIRLVPNTETALSSAAVLHNQLTGELGIELLLVKDGSKTWIAQTTAVQDITSYARRDQGRPKRDARVGMLPPKLAQIIVNLATGTETPSSDFTVLDPFCGTGVVLQETLLAGFSAYGTDLEPRMTDFTATNIDWLRTQYPDLPGELILNAGDATTLQWEYPIHAVASETYLGRPLSSWPNPETLQDIMGACNTIIRKFLENIAGQVTPGTRLCLALPAWHSPNGQFRHLQLLDQIEEIGYNRHRFEHVRDDDLVYFRPEQLVARELLVITRK